MNSGICTLDNYSIIQVSGEDAAKFLHGQITVDTENWNDDSVRITAHCDFKGKMWSIAYLLKTDTGFLMLIEKAAAEQTLAQLKKYGVFSKVSIDINDQIIPMSFIGNEMETVFEEVFTALPKQHLTSINKNGNILFCVAQSTPRYIGLLSVELYETLKPSFPMLAKDDMLHEWLEINDGYGVVSNANINEYVPQMFNLQSLQGIDFDKGCYMGQEVIARTKYLGKNKRALYLLEVTSEAVTASALDIGVTLERQVGDNWRRAGDTIRVAHQESKTRCLAVLPNDIESGDILRSKDKQSLHLTVLPLPYTVADE